MGIVAFFALVSWVLWARKWFTGPIREIMAEEAGISIAEPGAFEKAEEEGKVPPVSSHSDY